LFCTGKGESNWDVNAHTPGFILNNDTGDVAADSYHNYPEDVNLLRSLKVWVVKALSNNKLC